MSSSPSSIEILSTTRVTPKGGVLLRAKHPSRCNNTDMTFGIFLPSAYTKSGPESNKSTVPLPAIYWLSGLTCTDENFCQKAGSVAFSKADKAGIAIVIPDTSPRGESVHNDDAFDLGSGAGFYINATESPWKENYQMETYCAEELPRLVQDEWNVGTNGLQSICGHSMGGHGALTNGFKQASSSQTWVSVSALAPICHVSAGPIGQKIFTNYLGSVEAGKAHDATLLLQENKNGAGAVAILFDDILIDEGLSDGFAQKGLLQLQDLEAAAEKVGQKITVRRQEGFDHGFYFVAAFIADHVTFHSERLHRAAAAATSQT